MSSTNRNNTRDKWDYYITPQEDITKFIKAFINVKGEVFTSKIILDPCAGGDISNDMSYPAVLNSKFPKTIITGDIREDSLADVKCNYLETDIKDIMQSRLPEEYMAPDIIITNPPFNNALPVIKKALKDVKDGGLVIMLLRLNFFGSQKRLSFWEENMPKYAFVHSKRMSFTADGKTDSIEYMHCVWEKGEKSNFTKLKVI